MKRTYVSALAALSLTSSLYAGSPNDYTGAVWATGSTYCPTDSLPADGRTVDINIYQPLFSLFGTTYGGDGVTKFALPNLNGRTPVGVGTGKDNTGTNNLTPVLLGQQRGQASVPLTPDNLPTHTHNATFAPSGTITTIAVNVQISDNVSGNANAPLPGKTQLSASTPNSIGAKMWAPAPLAGSITLGGVTASNGPGIGSVRVDTAGNGGGFSVIPPEIGVTYCVTVDGIYPVKSN
jgi:microcystin-dependent protein